MKTLYKTKVFFLLALTCTSLLADTLTSTVEARQLSDKVMAKVGSGDVEGGIRLTKPYIIIPPSEFEVMLEQLKLQQPVVSQRFGKTIGSEFIREDKVGENLLRTIYIHRFEKHAMRWSFYFYRGKTGWTINTFKTDDDLRQLFPQ